ncbi:hypothetical protein [Azospirillum sp.]|uniref:hypothetical protein n=1 Tax=Azospirillum sp. TaxID=34012 RepID=UPI003D719B33
MSYVQTLVPLSEWKGTQGGAKTPPKLTRLDRLESDDLLAALGAFRVDDLDPIVRILTEKEFVTREKPLKDQDVFKRHAPNHRHYLAEIVDEIRWYGSHDITDAKEPRSYRAIVAELCGRAKIEVGENTSVLDMERLLLRNRVEAEKAGAASTGEMALGVAKAAIGFGAIRWLGAVTGPVGLGLTAAWAVWDLFGPNYKMTARCVLTIAEARLRLWCAAVADEVEG